MPSQTFSHAVMITSPSDEIWERLQQPATWEEIPGVDAVTDAKSAPDGSLQGFRFTTEVAGRSYRGTATITESEQPVHMLNEIETSEVRGSVDLTLEESGMETFLMAKMTVSPVGILSSMAFPVIAAAISSGFAEAVEKAATPDL
ncbi:MAG: hypothetical protein GEU79_04305 [Acidimicrobiia bacterium]|nr:hypothetical protein [Acidimicrobiia bacterium]